MNDLSLITANGRFQSQGTGFWSLVFGLWSFAKHKVSKTEGQKPKAKDQAFNVQLFPFAFAFESSVLEEPN